MAPPKVLVLGHSFVRRLKFDLQHQSDLRMSPSFKLEGTARVYMRGIGGRTAQKLRQHDLDEVSRLSPDIVLLEIGTNGLSYLSDSPAKSGPVTLTLDNRFPFIFVC